MPYTAATVQLLSPEGALVQSDANEQYIPYVDKLSDDALYEFHRHMVVMRRFDIEAANLQRQGQLALWIPSNGQEAAQVGSALAAKPQDHLFPAYREHVIARIRGVDPVTILAMLRGLSHGGWDPKEHNNFHLYTLVIGSQTSRHRLRDGDQPRWHGRHRRPRQRHRSHGLLRRWFHEPG